MLRWTRACIPLLSVVLATAACGGNTTIPAPGAAQQAPAVTATASPQTTATPTSTTISTPAATPSPTPMPVATATPSPEPTVGPHAIEYAPLTTGEPRPLPAGTALYYGYYHSPEVCRAQDVFRVIANEGTAALLVDRPWAFFDARAGYVASYGVGPRGQRLAALECERGVCASEHAGPTEDALLSLWVSGDGGLSWENWGEVPQGTGIWAVADSDVALNDDLNDTSSWREGSKKQFVPHEGTWWYRSDEVVAPPDYSLVWGLGANDSRYHPEWVDPSGQRLAPPFGNGGEPEYPWWWLLRNSAGGALIWSRSGSVDGEPDRIVVQDAQGKTTAAFSWIHPSNPLHLTGAGVLSENLLVGAWGSPTCGSVMSPVLVDLEGQSVHPILGLPPAGYPDYIRLLAARAAP